MLRTIVEEKINRKEMQRNKTKKERKGKAKEKDKNGQVSKELRKK